MITAVKQCPRCGRYCTPYIITTWTTEWKCTCGYDSAVNGGGIVYSYSTAETLYNEQALTDLRTSRNDQTNRQIQKEGGVPSLKA
jgi:hypothetical protein